MAVTRLNLINSWGTINLLSGNTRLREGGLQISSPSVDAQYASSPFAHGDSLASIRYGNRNIQLNLKTTGTSLSDLKTNLRTIERMMDDASTYSKSPYVQHGILTATGKLNLELQWGDSANQSTYFEVVNGALSMPSDFYTVPLTNSFMVKNAVLSLNCRPFGYFGTQAIAQSVIQNSQSVHNLQDYFTPSTGGWVYLKAQSTAIYGANWGAQTFTAGANATVSVACVPAARIGTTVSSLTCALYTSDGTLPTGSAITTGTASTLWQPATGGTIPSFYKVALSAPGTLVSGSKYALGFYCDGADIANKLDVYYNTDYSYASGKACFSTNGGTTWSTISPSVDFPFGFLSASSDKNYVDVTCNGESYGDVPAGLYLKVAETAGTGASKLFVSKRSGFRQTDNLWIEGENNTAFLKTSTLGTGTFNRVHLISPSRSGGMYLEASYSGYSVSPGANTEIGYVQYFITTPPRGKFRVLARVKTITDTAGEYDHISYGVGYVYGSTTKTPSVAEYYQSTAYDVWETLDLGIISIPPTAESYVAINNNLNLYIYCSVKEAVTVGSYGIAWYIDYIFLMPVDEGYAAVNNVHNSDLHKDTIAFDTISPVPNIYEVYPGGQIDNIPTKAGQPFDLGRENTRIYVLSGDTGGTPVHTVDMIYQPRFLVV